jgi:hypothetical protein
MTKETPTSQVPLLDLAPKLKRPLSIWNPVDYLLLLYWAFYFPQAIPWYEENFCEYKAESYRLNWKQRWESFRIWFRKWQLSLMNLFLVVAIPLLVCFCLKRLGFSINWFVVSGSVIGSTLFINVCRNIGACVVAGSFGSVIGSLFLMYTSNPNNDVNGFIFGFGFSLWAFYPSFISVSVRRPDLINDSSVVMRVSILEEVAIIIARIMSFGTILAIFLMIIAITKYDAVWDVIYLLLLDLLIVTLSSITILSPLDRYFSFDSLPRITPLIIESLSHKISKWLEDDWNQGIRNINQILKYSRQLLTVDKAINNFLNKSDPNFLIARISSLSDLSWNQEILRYTSASVLSTLKIQFIENILWLPYRYKLRFANRWNTNLYLQFDNPIHIAAAGFWYLSLYNSNSFTSDSYDFTLWKEYKNYVNIDLGEPEYTYTYPIAIAKSLETFAQLREIRYGEEMYYLVFALNEFIQAKDFNAILKVPKDINQYSVNTSDLLRTHTWKAIDRLSQALAEIRLVNQSISPTTRSLAFNRAIGDVIEVIDYLENLDPETSRVEKPILKDIATCWRDILLPEARNIGYIEITQPIANPYTIGDPVIGERFIGREDILRQLEELWFINSRPQSVILYGHRRMGKTSILRNATTKVNTEVRVAYVNLLSVSSANNGITDILMAICDALEEITEIPVPSNNDLHQFPETTFRRYLEQITKTFTGKGLIIALDEFEKIEELIDAGKLSKDFLGFLRGMVQMSSKLAFAFAGLHTLQEMNADYFQPFYASFIPISVAFLTREATHQVLANPDPEFLLEYESAALDHIYDLTNGQPYLTQLIGFQLVRMFNDYVFEQGKPRDRTFTIDDVRTICSGENFFTTGINYFNGVWQQAAEGAIHQQDILKALAPHPQGIPESELISQTNLPSATLQAALKALKDHDVIRSQKTDEIVNYAIAVELFRTWVVKYKLSDT